MSGLRRRWQMKPPLGVQINWSHPISQGLTLFLPLNESGGAPADLVSRRVALRQSTLPFVWQVGPKGTEFSTNGADAWLEFSSPINSFIPSDNVTIAQWHNITSNFPTQSAAFGVDVTVPNRLQAHAPYADGIIYWDVGDYTAGGRISTSALTWSDGYHLIACTSTTTGTPKMAIYRDGVQLATGGTPGVPDLSSAVWRIGNGVQLVGGASGPITGTVAYHAVWKRVLSPLELQQLYVEPYCFLNPPGPRRLWIIPSTVTTLSCSVFN